MWGQGFASEAVLEVVRFGHVALALRRIEAWTHPDNNASQRVLEKAGFVYEGHQRAKILMGESWEDVCLFARLSDDPPQMEQAEPAAESAEGKA